MNALLAYLGSHASLKCTLPQHARSVDESLLYTVPWKVMSRAKNSGRQCHFKIWLDCHKLKKCSWLIMPMSTKCQKIEKRMTII
jgi:hypothetical protein